ncbi:hypothetical protein Tco_0240325, partial [Tanacetum coccineum]
KADLYGFADMLDAAPGRQTSRELGYGITSLWDDLSIDACDQVRSEGISLWTTVMAQQSEITELQAADRR